jgi:hypothetical protein
VRVLAWAKIYGPVDEIQVKVINLKLSEGVIEGGLHGSRVMLGVPELASDEYIFTFEARNVLVGTFDALGNFPLVLVAVIGGKCRQRAFMGALNGDHSSGVLPSSLRGITAQPSSTCSDSGEFRMTAACVGAVYIHLCEILLASINQSKVHEKGRYTYKVTVSNLQRLVNAIANLTRRSLPGTVP